MPPGSVAGSVLISLPSVVSLMVVPDGCLHQYCDVTSQWEVGTSECVTYPWVRAAVDGDDDGGPEEGAGQGGIRRFPRGVPEPQAARPDLRQMGHAGPGRAGQRRLAPARQRLRG